MSEKVRVGVVGTSWWADWLYFPSLRTHPRAELAAVCGRSRERAQEMADKYNIPQVFTDYREMFTNANIDAVIISVPDDWHYVMTMAALDSRLHVLCEKPLALNAAHARAMYEKAETAGVKHMVFFTYRWIPQFRYVHELVEQGFIGRCFQADLNFRMGWARDGKYMWRANQHRANGVLSDLGSHLIDFTRWCVGEISSVSAQLYTFVERAAPPSEPFEPANDSAVLALKLSNDAQATLQLSMVTKPIKGEIELQTRLYGENGTLEADIQMDDMIRAVGFDDDEAQSLSIPDDIWGDANRNDSWSVLFTNSTGARFFIDAIIENQPISPNFYDGWKAQQVIDAAFESDRTGRWVAIH